MYGEKEEKVQELLLDLEDVKEMYKQQVNIDEPFTCCTMQSNVFSYLIWSI